MAELAARVADHADRLDWLDHRQHRTDIKLARLAGGLVVGLVALQLITTILGPAIRAALGLP